MNQTPDFYTNYFCQLFADDFQVMLSRLNEACNGMHLKINAEKTKVMIFGMNEGKVESNFAIRDAELEIVNEFMYLDRMFTSDGRMDGEIKSFDLLKIDSNFFDHS